MPDMDGFEVLRALPRENLPEVIFLTAYEQHAVRAFEIHALDYLLKPIDDERFASAIERSPFLGALFEGFVAAEIVKSQADRGMRKELYYFRDQQGLEVDFLVPRPNAKLWLVEAKSSKTVRPPMASPLTSLQRALKKRDGRLIVVHRKSQLRVPTAAIAKGVEALDLGQFVSELLSAR
jgi:DNA-binding LytR/AlgR family response regulator